MQGEFGLVWPENRDFSLFAGARQALGAFQSRGKQRLLQFFNDLIDRNGAFLLFGRTGNLRPVTGSTMPVTGCLAGWST
jgi:hypothetical protein